MQLVPEPEEVTDAVLFLGNDWAEAHTTSSWSTSPAGGWPVGGCPRVWRGWPRCTR